MWIVDQRWQSINDRWLWAKHSLFPNWRWIFARPSASQGSHVRLQCDMHCSIWFEGLNFLDWARKRSYWYPRCEIHGKIRAHICPGYYWRIQRENSCLRLQANRRERYIRSWYLQRSVHIEDRFEHDADHAAEQVFQWNWHLQRDPLSCVCRKNLPSLNIH